MDYENPYASTVEPSACSQEVLFPTIELPQHWQLLLPVCWLCLLTFVTMCTYRIGLRCDWALQVKIACPSILSLGMLLTCRKGLERRIAVPVFLATVVLSSWFWVNGQ